MTRSECSLAQRRVLAGCKPWSSGCCLHLLAGAQGLVAVRSSWLVVPSVAAAGRRERRTATQNVVSKAARWRRVVAIRAPKFAYFSELEDRRVGAGLVVEWFACCPGSLLVAVRFLVVVAVVVFKIHWWQPATTNESKQHQPMQTTPPMKSKHQ